MGSDSTFLVPAAEAGFAIAVPIVLYLLNRLCHVFDGIRPTGVLLGLLALMYYVNAIPFVNGECHGHPDLALRYLGVLLVMFVGVGTGILVSDQFVRGAGEGGATWRLSTGVPAFGNSVLFSGTVLTMAGVAAYHFVATASYSTITQFASFEGDSWFLIELRQSAARQVPGTYAANLARFAVLPPLALAMVSNAQLRRTTVAIALAALAWTAVLLSRMATLHKSPPTFWLLGLFLMFATLGRVKRPMRLMAVAIAGATALMAGLYGFVYGAGLSEGWELTVERTTEVPQSAILLYLRTFPDLRDHLYGQSISFLQRLAGDEVVPSYGYLMEIWRLGGTPNAGFVGDGWADFGWPGVIGTSVLVGLTTRGLESTILAMPRVPLFHGCYVGVVLSTVNLPSGSFWTVLLTHGLGLGPIVVLLLWLLRGNEGAPGLTPREGAPSIQEYRR